MGDSRSSNGTDHWLVRAPKRGLHWIVFRGNRLAIVGTLLLFVFAALVALTGTGVFAVGPDSAARTLFSSGLTSGILTVVTLVLSINQLILSRVFGSPSGLGDRLEGTKEFRSELEEIADVPSTPNDPAAFLALIGATIARRGRDLRRSLDGDESETAEKVRETLDDVVEYGDEAADSLEPEMSIAAVLDFLLATEYARKMTAVHEARNLYGERLTDEQREDLEAIESLFGLVAISRQFFKTLALQENFAHLSRIIATTGLAAFFATVTMTLLYRTNALTIDPGVMPLVASAGLTIIVAPVIAVIVYVLRAATIAAHTVSVGPFVPPGT